MERKAKEKNKSAAELQITSEQLLQEAYQFREEPLNKTKVKIADLEELHESQRRKRTDFEDALRRNRLDFGQWMRYAVYEIEQRDFKRARSVFERALEVNNYHVPLWIRYIDSELKNRNINHARNLFDRVTKLLPRVDKFWFRYVQTEETLGNIVGARIIFKRWMKWEPDYPCWDAFISFETRYDEFDNVREIFSSYVKVYPFYETWSKWVKFEIEHGKDPELVRSVYSNGIDQLRDEKLIVSFAHWEGSQKEFERARAIFKYGLNLYPHSKVLQEGLTQFEKQFGDKDGIEFAIMEKRKLKYEQELSEDWLDFDNWWDYLNLLRNFSIEAQRDAFEKCCSLEPEFKEKRFWKTFALIHIRFANFEELNNNVSRVSEIYKSFLNKTSSLGFTFSKIWINYAKFEIRQNNLPMARKILGNSIGKFPKKRTFKFYIELEIKLKEFDRVRKIYEKFIESFPYETEPWLEYAELEEDLNDIERGRGIYKIALELLSYNSKVFEKYIQFEINQRNYDGGRSAYLDLIEFNKLNTESWIKSAIFELNVPTKEQLVEYETKLDESGLDEDDFEYEFEITEEAKEKAREIFEKSLDFFKSQGLKDERITVLESLKEFELRYGDEESLKKVEQRLPTVVKKTKVLDDGTVEEFIDYVFPDDKKFSKFLENAKKWASQAK